MPIAPTRESLRARPRPAWYDNAKLGLMVHWGPYSVPAWAERSGIIQDLWSQKGPGYMFRHNPYAEWYLNTIQIAGSGAQRHHRETYGGASYDDFVPQFNAAAANADFASWADLFAQAHARYVVLITKHHDGFLLWPSRTLPPKPHYVAARDIVGGVTEAVRARGIEMGLYYSGGLDKLFNPTVIRGLATAVTAIPQGEAYARYCDAHIEELTERYRPAVLWNDIAYPAHSKLNELFARYYNAVPNGVVNDRWTQIRLSPGIRRALLIGTVAGIERAWPLLPKSWRRLSMRSRVHHDFRTPEYETFAAAQPEKWESVRGLGYSFGNNREERDEDMISVDELVRMFVDVVSKNGNLMVGIAPDANGVFPETQRKRILGLGAWLATNGEAVFDTRPWERAPSTSSGQAGTTPDGLPVRFTCTDAAVYAIVLGTPAGPALQIDGLAPADGAPVHLLGHPDALAWERTGDGLSITLPPHLEPSPAYAVRIATS